MKSFAQARPYIYIDENDLNVSVEYLKTVQNPEEGPLLGCFFERLVEQALLVGCFFERLVGQALLVGCIFERSLRVRRGRWYALS